VCKTLVIVCGSRDAPHVGAACLPVVVVLMVDRGRGPLRTLLVPLLATLGAMDGDVGWHLLATAWGCLPATQDRMKFGRLIAGGVLGGDVVLLLSGVPENVIVCTLSWVPCATFGSRTYATLASMSVSLGFGALALLPQWGSGREISWW
jgi:hypothetical protein